MHRLKKKNIFVLALLLALIFPAELLSFPSSAAAAGIPIRNSARFISGNSDYLNRTFGAGNRQTWTYSAWVKRGTLGTVQIIVLAGTYTTDDSAINFSAADQLQFYDRASSVITGQYITTSLFRDPAAWLHIVVMYDSTNATAADRVQIWVNGVRQPVSVSTALPLNTQSQMNSAVAHYLGRTSTGAFYLDSYLADVYFVDGQALTQTSFGVTDSNGYWRPILYTGTYGTNGFHLAFGNSSSLGTDTSSNGNIWTVNNLAATDWMKDSPTNGFATGNPLALGGSPTYTQGNLVSSGVATSTIFMSTGKWYWELTANAAGVSAGVMSAAGVPTTRVTANGVTTGFRFDADAGTLATTTDGSTFSSNITGLTGGYFAYATGGSNTFNFGQGGLSGLTYDGTAGGYFKYTPTSGYKALSTANLPIPAITIPKNYFNAVTYSGTGTTLPVTPGSRDSLMDFAAWLAVGGAVAPTAGGSLTIDGQSLGSYDYVIKEGNQTVSSFTNSDWFTTTEDSRAAFVIVKGNLTINNGVNFIPSNRKLFVVVYVTGDLEVNGTLSMTARGAYHGAGGSNITATALRIANGTHGGVTSPEVPSTGGAGAAAASSGSGNATGVTGTGGVNGGTGGGGSGGVRNNSGTGLSTSGAGATGTTFSGGSGGGGVWSNGSATAGSGTVSGGPGGNGAIVAGGNDPTAFGGAGNLSGTAAGPLTQTSTHGTGGVLVAIAKGALKGSGIIEAKGSKGGYYAGADTRGTSGGGGSGGGSVTVLYGSDSSSLTLSAAGGDAGTASGSCASGTCEGNAGGAGGAGTARKLTLSSSSFGFTPDFVWLKDRTAVNDHGLFDSVRGVQNWLASNLTNAETASTTSLTAFNSNGFTLGSSGTLNKSGNNYVAWNWKESVTAGFDIVTYTGDDTSNRNISHSLGAAPDMVIVKRRSATSNWWVWHSSFSGATAYALLNSTAATSSTNSPWGTGNFSSTQFMVSSATEDANRSGGTYVSYLFRGIEGFSKFGSFTGNGSADGPFVYTGFKPRYVMVKRTDSTSDWYIWDTSRDTFNVATSTLLADTNGAETFATSIDVLSNGFKARSATVVNVSTGTYIYAAFAEVPFYYSALAADTTVVTSARVVRLKGFRARGMRVR